MTKETFKNYNRVSRKTAEKAYNAGKLILIAPCNVNMYFMIRLYGIINDDPCDKSFDSIVSEYEYYNCNNELGKYAKFFVESDE